LEGFELWPPIWTAIPPKVEEKLIGITTKRSEACHKQTGFFRGNKELESTIDKLGNFEMSRRTTSGGLEKQAYYYFVITNGGLEKQANIRMGCHAANYYVVITSYLLK
jgi:hypothetical protein